MAAASATCSGSPPCDAQLSATCSSPHPTASNPPASAKGITWKGLAHERQWDNHRRLARAGHEPSRWLHRRRVHAMDGLHALAARDHDIQLHFVHAV